MDKTWKELTSNYGSSHYKTGSTQPIDLYRSFGVLVPFALGCIIKYAARCANRGVSISDLRKIIHYAELLIADYNETFVNSNKEIKAEEE